MRNTPRKLGWLPLIVAVFASATQAQTPPQNATTELGGTPWQLLKFQGGDDSTLTPVGRSKDTIAFDPPAE